jgi:hypothetical protein
MGKTGRRLTDGQENGGVDKMHGEGSFYCCILEGGWDGSALAASAQPRPVSSTRTRGSRRCSERLLRWPRVEATRAWRCPLAAGGGEVDGASELRRATRHDGECQCTLSTQLCALE